MQTQVNFCNKNDHFFHLKENIDYFLRKDTVLLIDWNSDKTYQTQLTKLL